MAGVNALKHKVHHTIFRNSFSTSCQIHSTSITQANH